MDNGPFLERGSSGGMLDEDEFYYCKFDDWIYFSLIFIDESITDFVLKKINDFHITQTNLDFRLQ
jgi:hypothetical protein